MAQVAQKKNSQIRIRCLEETKKEFRKVVVDFKNSEEAIQSFIKVYKQTPWVFTQTRGTGARIK